MSGTDNGDLISTFSQPWSDGTTGITLPPLELLEKLAALVPLPRVHLVHDGAGLPRPRRVSLALTRPHIAALGLAESCSGGLPLRAGAAACPNRAPQSRRGRQRCDKNPHRERGAAGGAGMAQRCFFRGCAPEEAALQWLLNVLYIDVRACCRHPVHWVCLEVEPYGR
jgi:hypothetical protein